MWRVVIGERWNEALAESFNWYFPGTGCLARAGQTDLPGPGEFWGMGLDLDGAFNEMSERSGFGGVASYAKIRAVKVGLVGGVK